MLYSWYTSKCILQNILDQSIKYLSDIIYQSFMYLNTRQVLILHHSHFFFVIFIVLLNTSNKQYVVYLFGRKHHQRFYLVIIILNFHSHVGDFLVIYRNLTMWHSFFTRLSLLLLLRYFSSRKPILLNNYNIEWDGKWITKFQNN